MENIIKLNINKTANRETEQDGNNIYIIATSAVQLISYFCGHSFQRSILIFVVTLYNDLADRARQQPPL